MNSTEFISRKTRHEFCQYLTNWTIREIEVLFDNAEIERVTDFQPVESSQRRALVLQYYHALDFTSWPDVQKVLSVFESILEFLDEPNPLYPSTLEANQAVKAGLLRWLKKDGFELKDGRLVRFTGSSALPVLKEVATKLDAHNLYCQIDRMEKMVDSNPDLVIGTAKELLETTCKTILKERGVDAKQGIEILDLVNAVRKELRLMPDDIPEAAQGADTIKKLSRSLGAVTQCLAELRNAYGTGHGAEGRARGLRPRHARLAVSTAAALATFFFETHIERESG